eukprot:237913-Rhodomonas_salina.4
MGTHQPCTPPRNRRRAVEGALPLSSIHAFKVCSVPSRCVVPPQTPTWTGAICSAGGVTACNTATTSSEEAENLGMVIIDKKMRTPAEKNQRGQARGSLPLLPCQILLPLMAASSLGSHETTRRCSLFSDRVASERSQSWLRLISTLQIRFTKHFPEFDLRGVLAGVQSMATVTPSAEPISY